MLKHVLKAKKIYNFVCEVSQKLQVSSWEKSKLTFKGHMLLGLNPFLLLF